jgi:hypothetical protein
MYCNGFILVKHIDYNSVKSICFTKLLSKLDKIIKKLKSKVFLLKKMNPITDNIAEYESAEKSSRVTLFLKEKLNTLDEERDEYTTSLLKYLLYANPNQSGLTVQTSGTNEKKEAVNSNLQKISSSIDRWLADTDSTSTELLDYSGFEKFTERIHVKTRVVFATSSILDAIELCNLLLTKLCIEESHGKEWPERARGDNEKLIKKDGVADFSKYNIKALIKKLSNLLVKDLPSIINDMYEAHYTKYGKFSYNDHKIKMHLAEAQIIPNFIDYLQHDFTVSLKRILGNGFLDTYLFGHLKLDDAEEVTSNNYINKLQSLLNSLLSKKYITNEEAQSFYNNFVNRKISDKEKVLAIKKMVELKEPRKKYILRKWFYVNTSSDNTTYGECYLKFVQSFAVCLSKKLFGKGGKKINDISSQSLRGDMNNMFKYIYEKLQRSGISQEALRKIKLEIDICTLTDDKDRLQESIKTIFLDYLSFDGNLPKFHEFQNDPGLMNTTPKILRLNNLLDYLKQQDMFNKISLSLRFVELDILFSYFKNNKQELTYEKFLIDVNKLGTSLWDDDNYNYVINDILANLIFNIFNITFDQLSHKNSKGKVEKYKTITHVELSKSIVTALGDKISEMKTSESITISNDRTINFIQKFVLTAVSKIKVKQALEKESLNNNKYDYARKYINRLQHYIDVANQSFSSLKETIDIIKKKKLSSDKKQQKDTLLNMRQQQSCVTEIPMNKSSGVYVNSPPQVQQQAQPQANTEDDPFNTSELVSSPQVKTEDDPFNTSELVSSPQAQQPQSNTKDNSVGRSRSGSVSTNTGTGEVNTLSVNNSVNYSEQKPSSSRSSSPTPNQEGLKSSRPSSPTRVQEGLKSPNQIEKQSGLI